MSEELSKLRQAVMDLLEKSTVGTIKISVETDEGNFSALKTPLKK